MASSSFAYSNTSAPSQDDAERYAGFGSGIGDGPHPIIDITMHWDWRNPLNIVPAIVLLVLIVSVVSLI